MHIVVVHIQFVQHIASAAKKLIHDVPFLVCVSAMVVPQCDVFFQHLYPWVFKHLIYIHTRRFDFLVAKIFSWYAILGRMLKKSSKKEEKFLLCLHSAHHTLNFATKFRNHGE
jgi:hypothetical protein